MWSMYLGSEWLLLQGKRGSAVIPWYLLGIRNEEKEEAIFKFFINYRRYIPRHQSVEQSI
jgi:hypothetical protein